jgi:uncharacterized protein
MGAVSVFRKNRREGSMKKRILSVLILPYLPPAWPALGRSILGLIATILLLSGICSAASFDCDRATTLVEKLICSEPGLSQLDEKLSKTYEEVLRATPDRAGLKREQNNWLREVRNLCRHSVCLEEEYRNRLAALEKLLSVTMPSEKSAAKHEEVKYPPYPDIWDWHEPSTKAQPFSMHRCENGDVLIEYIKTSDMTKEIQIKAVTFFSRKIFAGESATEAIKKAKAEMRRRDGTDLEKRLNPMDYTPTSSDGRWNIEYVVPYDLNCYAGPNRYPFKLADTKTSRERMFTIFRLLDKQERFSVHSCPYESRRIVKYRVKSVSGGFFFLEDNSFLFHVHETGDVIRFDNDLKSKSSLINNKFFLIENDGGPSIMDRLTDNLPDDLSAEEETKLLYQYLTNMRRK